MTTPADDPAIREAVRSEFTKLGVTDVEGWVNRYFKYGPSALAQCVFLHAAWQEVVPPDGGQWMERDIELSKRYPGEGAGEVLTRLLAAGAKREDLAELVRLKQIDTLWGLCNNIDNTPGLFNDPVDRDLHWHLSLFKKCPAESIDLSGLHEMVRDFDPAQSEIG